MSVKKKATEVATTTKRVSGNLEQFVQAVSLLTVAVFSYYATKELDLNQAVEIFVTGSLVVIGLRGCFEFFKFLDK